MQQHKNGTVHPQTFTWIIFIIQFASLGVSIQFFQSVFDHTVLPVIAGIADEVRRQTKKLKNFCG